MAPVIPLGEGETRDENVAVGMTKLIEMLKELGK
jgi:hypothetical protein